MEWDDAVMLKALGKGAALALLGLLLNPVAIGADGNLIDIKQITQPAGDQFALRNSDSNVLIFNQDGLRNTIRGDATPTAITVTTSAIRLGSPGDDETYNSSSQLFSFSSANIDTTGGYSNFDASEITIPAIPTTSLTLFDGTDTEAQLTGAFIKLNVSQLGNDNDLGLNLSSHSASYQISITGDSNAMDLDVGGNGFFNEGLSEFFVGAPNTDFDASITGNSNSVFNQVYSDGENETRSTTLSYTLDGANNEFATLQAGISNRITADFDVDNSFVYIDQKGDSNEADIVLGGSNDYVQLEIRQNHSTGSTGNDIELSWTGGNDGTSFYLSQDGGGHFIDLDVANNNNQGPSVFDITQTGLDQSATLNLTGGGQFVKVTQSD